MSLETLPKNLVISLLVVSNLIELRVICGTATAGICFGIIILLLLEKTVLSRVAQLNTGVTEIAIKGDNSARVTIKGKDELSGLASSMNNMLGSLQKIETEIRTRNQEMRLIMNSVPSGLLSLDQNFCVNPEYSKSVEDILGCKDPSGKEIFGLLGFTSEHSEDRQKIFDFLDLYRQEILYEKEMAGLNPFDQLCLDKEQQKWICLKYFLIRRGEGLINHFLVVIEDITEEKKMQAKIMSSERENMQLKAIAEDPDVFRDFPAETRAIFQHAEKNSMRQRHLLPKKLTNLFSR